MALSWTMDKLGPLARTAADCAVVLATIAGPDPLDPSAVTQHFSVPAVPPRRRRKLKIGVLKGATDHIQAEVAQNFTAALGVLHDVIDVVPDVTLPDLPWGVVGGTIIAAEGSSAFDDLIESGRVAWLTAAEDRIGGYGALAIPARDYLRALRVRRLMGKAFDDFIKQFDAIAVPSRNSVASPVDKSFREAWPDVTGGASLIGPANVVGAPAISLLNGFGVAGLPTGISFTTRVFDEAVLVDLGRVYQERTDWHTRTPVIA
jgi:aspartyl-tRNA(Asn)/glutamyl-tRNA(Gln) amidotransferase subunit A